MTSQLKSVVIGAGEIGRAIHALLEPHYPAFLYDVLRDGSVAVQGSDFLHICFPYGPNFESEVIRYQLMFTPDRATIVHSTVPVGTCERLGVVHSPVRGKHHAMLQSLKTYTKFFGGEEGQADMAADLFLRIGVPVHVYPSAYTTELAKILETSFLGLLIRWSQAVDEACKEDGLSYTEVWDKFVGTYNEKCESLGQPKFPVLVPIHEKIGGHCVLPNLEFLPHNFPFTSLLRGKDSE
jgi:hypothetical protein